MFENNQSKYDMLQDAVFRRWPQVHEQEYSRTFGKLEKVLELVSHKTGLPESAVLDEIEKSIREGDENPFYKNGPDGVVNSEDPESEEWHARESEQRS